MKRMLPAVLCSLFVLLFFWGCPKQDTPRVEKVTPPEFTPTDRDRCIILCRDKQWGQALPYCEAAMNRDHTPEMYERTAACYLLSDEPDKARAASVLRAGLEKNPDSALLRSGLVSTLIYLERLDEAEAEARALAVRHPGKAKPLYLLASVKFMQGDYLSAIRYYEGSLTASPQCGEDFTEFECGDRYYKLCMAYDRTGTKDKAHAACLLAADMYPGNPSLKHALEILSRYPRLSGQ